MLGLCLLMLNSDDARSKFTAIYEKYHQQMFNVAMILMGNVYDAEEAVQSALFAIARCVDGLDTSDESLVEIYVLKAVRNTCYNMTKKMGRQPVIVSVDNVGQEYIETDVAETVCSNEAYQRLVEVIKSMPYAYRDVLVLSLVFEQSVKQTAIIMSRPERTVRSQLKRGRQILIKVLKEAKRYE